MKLYSWLIILFSLVMISFRPEGVEAAVANRMIRSLMHSRLYSSYCSILSNVLEKELLKLVPAPPALAIKDSTIIDIEDLKVVALLDDNTELKLGDVLIDGDEEVFFFLTATKKDPIVSTLLRASTGLYESNHKINLFTLIKKFEDESVHYLNYANDAEVRDHFKCIQTYGEYALLGSSCYQIVFVAPSADIDGFVRGEFQRRVLSRTNKERSSSPKLVEKKSYAELMGLRKDSITTEKPASVSRIQPDEFLESPDSVANTRLFLEDYSHIEMLFGTHQNSTDMRMKFIYERLVPILLENELNLNDAIVLVNRAEEIFRNDRMVEFIKVQEGENVTVVGDIHGQFVDLLRIFKNCGWPSYDKKFLFNGDIVDRGQGSLPCLILLYALKITFPGSIYINRGNHESEMCGVGTFYRDAYKFDPSGNLFMAAQRSFVALPIAHVINERIYVVHGGVRADYSVEELSKMDRFDINDFTRDFLISSMWDDASDKPGLTENRLRGPSSRCFGPDVTETFLERNELNLLIRSHTYVSGGIEVSQGGKCWTLFSAPNYGGMGNVAAVVTFDSDLVPMFSYFKAKKHGSPIEY